MFRESEIRSFQLFQLLSKVFAIKSIKCLIDNGFLYISVAFLLFPCLTSGTTWLWVQQMGLPDLDETAAGCILMQIVWLGWKGNGMGNWNRIVLVAVAPHFVTHQQPTKRAAKWLVAIVSIVLFGRMLYGRRQQRSLEKVPSTNI